MSKNPLNLALRFLLELVALYAMGYWGWSTHEGIGRAAWAIGLPLMAAVAWGTFRVPNDPGKAPIVVPGPVRLGLEALFFGGALWLLVLAGQLSFASGLAALLVVHYVASLDRVLALLRGEPLEAKR